MRTMRQEIIQCHFQTTVRSSACRRLFTNTLVFCTMLATPAIATTYTSIGNGSWSNTNNWDIGTSFPHAGDTAELYHNLDGNGETVSTVNVHSGGVLSGVRVLDNVNCYDGSTIGSGNFQGFENYCTLRILSEGHVTVTKLDNHGTIIQEVGSHVNVYAGNHTVLNNWAEGIYELQDNAILTWDDPMTDASMMWSIGTVRKTGAGYSTVEGRVFLDGGSFDIDSGVLILSTNQPSGYIVARGGRVRLNGGNIEGLPVRLTVSGELVGTGRCARIYAFEGGIVRPGMPFGILACDTFELLSSNCWVDLDIGGIDAGTQYDQIIVNDTNQGSFNAYNASLAVSLSENFRPKPGDECALVRHGVPRFDRQFATRLFPQGYFWQLEERTTNLSLLVTGERLLTNRVPPSWMAHYGWSNAVDADVLLDYEPDGVPTWQEYHAGTSPTDSTSRLIIDAIEPATVSNFAINWSSVPGKPYRLNANSCLTGTSWIVVSSNTATDTNSAFTVTNPSSAQPHFYRVSTFAAPWNSLYNYISISGNAINNWDPTSDRLALVSDHLWRGNAYVSNYPSVFKFSANGSWVRNWGHYLITSNVLNEMQEGVAEPLDDDIQLVVNGLCQFEFDDSSLTYSVQRLSSFHMLAIPNIQNGWITAGDAMNILTNYIWGDDIFIPGPTFEFKFAANDSWAQNWGDNDQSGYNVPVSGIGDSGGGNIVLSNLVSGTYRFIFNETSGVYSVSQVNE